MNWIQHPVILESKRIKIVPLEEKYINELVTVASDPEIWAHLPIDGSDADAMRTELKAALLKRFTGEQYPMVVIDKNTYDVIGATRLFNIYPEHLKLEIGWTWYKPAFWGTGYNTECKLLLLTHCFETLKAARVQFQTSAANKRSQAAIQKIGGKPEGLLRKDRVRRNEARDTLIYSIIDDEWPEVKQMLTQKIS